MNEIKLDLRTELHRLNWIRILKDAIDNRPTSWNKNPVIEWRNASDTVLMSLLKHLENRNLLIEPFREIKLLEQEREKTAKEIKIRLEKELFNVYLDEIYWKEFWKELGVKDE